MWVFVAFLQHAARARDTHGKLFFPTARLLIAALNGEREREREVSSNRYMAFFAAKYRLFSFYRLDFVISRLFRFFST